MDWLIDRQDPQSEKQAMSALADHLRRHAASQSGVDAAVRRLADLMSSLPPADGLLRLHLDWRAETPRVVLGAVDEAAVAEAGLGAGDEVPADHRAALDEATGEPVARVGLDVERRVQDTFDEGPPATARLVADPLRDGPASVAVALAASAEAHPTAGPEKTASMAGAALADAVAPRDAGLDGPAAARLIVEAHRALGSDARVVQADDSTVEIAMSRCPYGPGVRGARSLCHVSTGLAGRIGARVNGSATVVLDESIAAGDHECHLQMWLGTPEEEVRGETHRWPPTVSAPDAPTPHLDLSLNLPRESSSVPVVRRLAAQALRAFGVTDGDIDDVQLAITEACANVIDHAADTDTYEVKVELASDRCAITVVDQGGGFDATAVPEEAHHTAEDGRGLVLMRALVDNVAFRSEPQAGAVVHMVKSLRYDAGHPLRQRS